MSRIDDIMSALAAKKRKALVAYLCVGDPSHEESIELAVACANAGADVIELGVPFSDPTADGVAIAQASERALRGGGGLARSIEAAHVIRSRCEAALLLFGYYNPIFVRGEARTIADAHAAGIDGLLVVDLPVDEAATLRALCKERAMSLVPLLSPTSPSSRIERTREAVKEHSPGFLYYVSVTGVTGTGVAPVTEASARAGELRAALGVPVVVGFGIDTPEKARLAAKHADGVVVGTAIVRRIASGATATDRKTSVTDLIRSLRTAID